MNRKRFLSNILATYLIAGWNGCDLRNNKSDHNNNLTPSKIQDLKTTNTVQYFRKGDPEYESLRKGFNKRIDKHPHLIAYCKGTEEVVEAIHYARKNKMQVSVKSGGHSFEGFYGNNDGLVIDCSAMNCIKWIDNSSVMLGPGCLIKDIYKELLPKNKMLPAGSCGGVAIAGLTLGGGYGIFSRMYGLTCDSLKTVTLVDGLGKVHHSENDDELLWACKGGGNGNFGVVTEMEFTVHNGPELIQCSRFTTRNIDVSRAVSILKKWFALTETLPLSCFSTFVFNGKSVYILLTNTNYTSPDIQPILQELKHLTDKTNSGNPISLLEGISQFYGVSKPLYFKNASVGLYDGFQDIEQCIDMVFNKMSYTHGMIYQVNTLGGNIINHNLESGSSFPHRDKRWLSELQAYWQVPSKTYFNLNAFKETKALFKTKQNFQYCNYPDTDTKDWETSYYGKNYKRLQAVKQRLDPENNIRHEQSIKA